MMPAIKNQNWLPSLFNDFFGDEWLALSQYKRMSTPAVNVIENEHDFTVEVAAPGMTKEDFRIDVNSDNELVINLEKRSETKTADKGESTDKASKKGHYLRREFSYGAFRQSFTLPESIERDKISAKMENGVLKIEIPKKSMAEAAPASRCIEIK